MQQLRDGVLNFFVTFVEVRNDRRGARFEVEDGITSGDYLQGFLRGTRSALYEKGRESITMSIPEVNAFYIGALIALYERAVGFYGSLVNINAYDQPGVEAAKKRRANCCSSRNKCARSFPAKVKLPKKSRAQSTPIRRTFFTCCGIWRATMHESRSRPARKLRMIGFRSDNPSNYAVMARNSSENRTDSLSLPWSDTVRFVRQLSHDLRNDLNAIELQSAYISELAQDQELTE